MMPGASTGPGEKRENLDRRAGETSNHGEQVRHTRNFCTGLIHNDVSFRELTDGYHQGTKTKDELREEFKKRLKGSPAELRAKMGLTSATADPTETEVEQFLSTTKCFDNQLLAHIQNDIKGKEKAHENMVDNCLEVARDEYGSFDENELKKSLKKEANGRLRTFLEVPKYRKTYIKKLPGGHTLTEKNFGDIDFGAITQAIAKLDPTNPKRREIQEAWLKIAQVAAPESNLAEAFSQLTHEGGKKFDISGAYGAFFSDENTLISRENREKILNFLTQQYTPVVPLGVLEVLDPKTHKKILTSEADIDRDLPHDPDLATALKQDRTEQWEKTYKQYIGGGKAMIGSRTLPFETKIRLISQFGSIGKAEKMLEYYRGKPGSLRASTNGEEGFREKFKNTYEIDPEELDTKASLTEQLVARLGHRVEGIEHFEAGCAMEWKTKDKDGTEITGYYIIDSVPGDTLDEDNILTVRFLGDNRGTLSPGGLARHYTGADFYNYLDGCADDGRIIFRERNAFEEEIEKNITEKKLPRYPTDAETRAELRAQFSDTINVQNFEQLNREIDQLLNPKGDLAKEAKSPKERELHPGMIFCKLGDSGIDTFQIKEIDEDAGTITLWDGWGTGKKSLKELSFHDFLLTLKSLKKASSELYRVPTGGKAITINQFNILCGAEEQYADNVQKKMGQITIREEDGKNVFGKINQKTGVFTACPIIKVGEKQDLYIESIDGSTVTYRRGTFKQGNFDQEKDAWTQDPEFSGSPELTMSLEMLWAYLQNHHHFELEKPIEKAERKQQKEKDPSMSWWNILMHSHSLGVILHGDLWKAPFKAWEEQHHKDHAFHGKLTAALAMEKLQSGGYGPVSSIWNWAEWPSLMVADGNSSFQSYLNELVDKVDGMGSFHRTRLIKKWSRKEHFPSPKFMAAIMASMKIFGQLYPYDGSGDDYKNHDGTHEWFWYNSICHSIDPNHGKYPHMPPHPGEPWPKKWTTKDGYKMNEIDVLYEVFNAFKHPMLKNLGRRFQKYMNAGQSELADGGVGNLNQRVTMEEKLDWMMGTAVSSKLPELFGGATELWLTEGYSTEISSMPYAAVLFGCREEQMLGPTREHIKQQFQGGYHMPHFVFMQSKDFGDIFRETGIAFAYTISNDCGKELEKLTRDAEHQRLSGDRGRSWRSKFTKFWRDYGKELMHKLSGMRDPMLNLMINDPALFDELLEHQPEDKKKQYQVLREKKSTVRAYYQRLADTYGDSTSHAAMDRGKGYYAGDHFRFRDGFSAGTPLAWVNWDNYIDPNITKEYGNGSDPTSGDGVFNEMRGFLYAIPKLAEKMAEQMGFKGNKAYIDRITKSLFEKNRDPMRRLLKEKIDAQNPKTEYCSMTAMMLEIIPPQLLSVGGAPAEEQARYKKYFEQIKGSLRKAKEIEEKEGYKAALEYRCTMAKKWSEVVKGQIDTEKLSLEQIHEGQYDATDELSSVKDKTQARSGTILAKKLDEFDTLARKKDEPVQSSNRDSIDTLPE